MNILEGKVVAEGMKVGIVVARFNEFITSKLLSGAIDGLVRHDVNEDDVDVAWVPGAFEIPLVASKMAKSRKYDAVMFGVITTENIEQAIERSGSKAGNKGYECALGAIEMVNLIRKIK